jgi:hypothetical protein
LLVAGLLCTRTAREQGRSRVDLADTRVATSTPEDEAVDSAATERLVAFGATRSFDIAHSVAIDGAPGG